LIESTPGGGRRAGLDLLMDACVRHRAEPLEESVARIVRELRPEDRTVDDDLLLLAAEVTQ
jgi:hypothetical protein